MKGLPLIGRILFAAVFLPGAFNHFFNLSAMAEYAGSRGVPDPKVWVVLSGIMLLAGSLSVVLGYKAKLGALVLLAFLLPTTFMMHNFWAQADPMIRQGEMAHFLKNLSLMGGNVIIAHFGSGAYSLDTWRPKSAPYEEEVEAKAA